MRNSSLIDKIKQLKRQILVAFLLFFVVFGVPIFIFQITFSGKTIPVWMFFLCFFIYGHFFLFRPARELTNIQCPKCEKKMKLNIYTNIDNLKCPYCDYSIS